MPGVMSLPLRKDHLAGWDAILLAPFAAAGIAVGGLFPPGTA